MDAAGDRHEMHHSKREAGPNRRQLEPGGWATTGENQCAFLV